MGWTPTLWPSRTARCAPSQPLTSKSYSLPHYPSFLATFTPNGLSLRTLPAPQPSLPLHSRRFVHQNACPVRCQEVVMSSPSYLMIRCLLSAFAWRPPSESEEEAAAAEKDGLSVAELDRMHQKVPARDPVRVRVPRACTMRMRICVGICTPVLCFSCVLLLSPMHEFARWRKARVQWGYECLHRGRRQCKRTGEVCAIEAGDICKSRQAGRQTLLTNAHVLREGSREGGREGGRERASERECLRARQGGKGN